MFLFIPLLGVPLLLNKYIQSRFSDLFKLFVAGLLLVSVFLIVRIFIVFLFNLPEELSALEYFTSNNPEYVSFGFSVLEHPTYFSLKLVFALILLFNFSDEWKISGLLKWSVVALFTLTIFLLASKAGIIAWILACFTMIFKDFRKKGVKPLTYLIIFSLMIGLTMISVKKLDRLSFFIVYTGRGLAQENFDWKNLDQRTRNWYAAITLIRDHPVAGNGFVETEGRMVEVYQKNGFTEEAELTMNAHNQFLEAQMTFGIAGTLSLLWMLLTPLIFTRKTPARRFTLPFFLIFSFFILFESMLNRQWGIMFFLLFYFMLLFRLPPNSE
jgi:hypothetical protein